MDVLHTHCAGLDVHKKTVVAAVRVPEPKKKRGWQVITQTFGTMTADLLALSDWLLTQGVTHAAMESTGEYWKPVYNILEANFELLLVNPHHIKVVPGRKTDVSDAEWIAELLQYGLLRASFVPPKGQRALRELTRARTTFVRERATLVNRVQKVLESANLKLGDVARDVLGVSGRAMLEAVIDGQTSPEQLADLARGRLRVKHDQLVKALEGHVQPHHRFILAELLSQIAHLDETLERFNTQVADYCVPFEHAVALWDTIPGVARTAAEIIVSEIGTDMSRFPTADALSAWAGVAPGNNESAGRQRSSKTRQGNAALKTILVQVAHSASHTKGTYLAAQYHRIAARRGRKRAIMAVAHSILVIGYHLVQRDEPYHELGADYFDRRSPETTAHRLVRRLEHLGYQVALQSPSP
jgi:transposase